MSNRYKCYRNGKHCEILLLQNVINNTTWISLGDEIAHSIQ
jgi:hypothetical protein